MIRAESGRFTDSLQGEKYSSARFLGEFLSLCGEKGKLGIGLYQYLRWVDNTVDDQQIQQDTRVSFINRQRSILNRENLDDGTLDSNEALMTNLPWHTLSRENGLTVRDLATEIIDTCEFDVMHSDLSGRSLDEVNTYVDKMLKSAIRITSIIVNDKDINLDDKQFGELMMDWFMVASLRDFGEDLEEGLLHFPLPSDKVNVLQAIDSVEERRELIQEQLLPQGKFEELKRQYITSLLFNSFAFLNIDLPVWQRLLCSMYSFKGAIKHSSLEYPI